MNPGFDFRHVARCLREIADLSELLDEDAFKAPSYRRASRAVEESGPDVERLAAAGRLTDLPGVGPAIAGKIADILATGTCPLLERLRDRVPQEVVELMDIPGIGPRTVGMLWRQGGIADVDGLLAAAEAGRLRDLPGFGPRKETAILQAVRVWRGRAGRLLLGDAWPIAMAVRRLALAAGAQAAMDAGALRRREPVMEAADVAVACTAGAWPSLLNELRASLPAVLSFESADGDGATLAWSGRGRHRLRMWRADPTRWGADLFRWTGPEDEVDRAVAAAGGWDDVLARAGDRIAADGSGVDEDPFGLRAPAAEEAFFRAMGLDWLPPELRAFPDRVARLGDVRRLVTTDGWTAELHAHTTYSDGVATIAEMARAAWERGYRVLAVTDHSAALAVARGLDAGRLEAQAREIAALQANFPDVTLLAGTEADILRDGRLDIPEGATPRWVVASVHSSFAMERDAMTRRVVRALRTGRVHVLGHPTGRLLARREGFQVDLDAVFEAAREAGTAMEINASPARLDLGDAEAFAALRAGLPLAINTDAHSTAELDLVVYGVWTARRAGAARDDVLNTWEPERILDWSVRGDGGR